MFEAGIKESVLCRLAGGLWGRLLDIMRGSAIVRLLLGSRIISRCVCGLPLFSGVMTGLLFTVPHSLFNNFYSFIVLTGLTGLLLLGIIGGQIKNAALPRLGLYAAVFWLLVLAGGLVSDSLSLSLRFLIFHLTAFFALIVTTAVLTDRRALTRFVAALLAAVTVSGLYGLYQSMTGVEILAMQVDVLQNNSMPGRIFSFFDNPNNFAEVLVLTLPLFAAMFFTARTRPGRRAAFLMALPPAMALILSFSRSGWMAFGLGIVVFFYFTHRWVVPLLFAGALAALPLLPATISDRLLSIFTGADTSILYRNYVSEIFQPVISSRWLLGSGLGSDIIHGSIFENIGVEREMWTGPPHAHNHFLQIWAELGILGAMAFCGMIVTFIKNSAVSLFTAPKPNYIAAAGLAGIVGLLVMGYAEYVWFYPRVHLLFWTVMGVTLSAFRLEKAV